MDVYLSRKVRRNKDNKFGFIRYLNKKEAMEMAGRMDGTIIRDYKINVKESKYRKKDRLKRKYEATRNKTMERRQMVKKDTTRLAAWRDGQTYSEVVKNKETTNQEKPT